MALGSTSTMTIMYLYLHWELKWKRPVWSEYVFLLFVYFIIDVACTFSSECCVVGCGGWSRVGFGGACILSDLVQMAFWCLLCFGIMFI